MQKVTWLCIGRDEFWISWVLFWQWFTANTTNEQCFLVREAKRGRSVTVLSRDKTEVSRGDWRRFSGCQRAPASCSIRRQTTWWPHTGALERRQVARVGHHSRVSISGLLYVNASTIEAGSVAKAAAVLKTAKSTRHWTKCTFSKSLAVESLSPLDNEGCSFLVDLGQKISAVFGDDRDSTFLSQRISVLIQRHNSILLRQSFCDETRPDDDLQSSTFS